MRNISLFLILSAVAVSCGDNGKGKQDNGENGEAITQEHISNPATADNPKASTEAMAAMTFKSTFHDFGDMVENQSVETTFEFTNTGNADLLISSCDAQCGCTVPDWPRKPIAPGESGAIKVVFNSAGKSGENNKTVTVHANIPEKSIELKFKAKVKALTN